MNPGSGINPPSVREAAADDDIVQPDQQGQGADGRNNGQGGKPGRRKSETKHIGLAGSPISVKERRGPLPIEIARALNGNVVQEAVDIMAEAALDQTNSDAS